MGLLRAHSNQSVLQEQLCRLHSAILAAPQREQSTGVSRASKRAKQLRSGEIAELVAAYEAGAKIKDLARRFSVHRATVCEHLNQYGVARHARGLQQQDVPQAVQLYQEGWSLARISARFGTTDNTVRARLLEAGVRMRAPWERRG